MIQTLKRAIGLKNIEEKTASPPPPYPHRTVNKNGDGTQTVINHTSPTSSVTSFESDPDWQAPAWSTLTGLGVNAATFTVTAATPRQPPPDPTPGILGELQVIREKWEAEGKTWKEALRLEADLVATSERMAEASAKIISDDEMLDAVRSALAIGADTAEIETARTAARAELATLTTREMALRQLIAEARQAAAKEIQTLCRARIDAANAEGQQRRLDTLAQLTKLVAPLLPDLWAAQALLDLPRELAAEFTTLPDGLLELEAREQAKAAAKADAEQADFWREKLLREHPRGYAGQRGVGVR